MALIEFENLPSTQTPLSAENLNHNFNELNNANIYSTNETDTGKKWVNGKPIYRKVFVNQNGPTTTYTNLNHNILNIEEIINIYGTMVNPTDLMTTNIPMIGTSSLYGGAGINVRADGTKIQYESTADYSANKCNFVIEYTKTTD